MGWGGVGKDPGGAANFRESVEGRLYVRWLDMRVRTMVSALVLAQNSFGGTDGV